MYFDILSMIVAFSVNFCYYIKNPKYFEIGEIMNMKNEIIEKPIYNICTVIHRLCKLNLEFIGTQLEHFL